MKKGKPTESADTLIRGKRYLHTRSPNGMQMSPRPLKYCGTQRYKDRINHEFWDDETRLLHWLEPEEVERA